MVPAPLPSFATRIAERLAARGIRSAVVGRLTWSALGALPRSPGSLREARLLCEMRADALHRLPDAVCLGPGGPVWIATREGCVEVRAAGERPLEEALRAAPFRVLGVAIDPLDAELLDPVGGRADLEEARLGLGPEARPGLGPRAALAGARLCAELGLRAEEETLAALRSAAPALAERGSVVRHELEALLLAPAPARGLDALRRSGLEAVLAPGVGVHAGELVERAPATVSWRFAAWLLGTPAASILATLRTPRDRARWIEAVVALHPIERTLPPREAACRRAVRRLGSPVALRTLAGLRRLELALAGRGGLERSWEERFAQALAALERGPEARLVWSGREVMEVLELDPGPEVGRVLAFLRERVARDPSINTPEGLRSCLEAWRASTPAGGGPHSG